MSDTLFDSQTVSIAYAYLTSLVLLLCGLVTSHTLLLTISSLSSFNGWVSKLPLENTCLCSIYL